MAAQQVAVSFVSAVEDNPARLAWLIVCLYGSSFLYGGALGEVERGILTQPKKKKKKIDNSSKGYKPILMY